ncbi:uncharacterized protein BJ212DRAFT_1497976 [Suillus subaureus]|uniref:proline--tRNA ligase n=1 Tax=Suillus subaureus TaxID=48587 RepID=A0A9P7DQF9_9AGAM|nr:uncharacterized protein BJ212DRAFT_1497976 [Suillus subaureus]KAG1800638.1 hypothetical protein BJ212DRAFT_1497976 [Suillus subaureus]
MNSLESVAQSLAGLSITPSASLIKTLVDKPKTAKTAIPVPVVVIAREETETSSSALGKKLNLKELRLASEDLLAEFFALDKDSLSLLSLTSETFPKVVTVIDASITSSSSTFALHALSSSATVFLSGQDILSYLRKLGTEDLKVQEIDFTSLKSDVEKEVAKIDGAVQIAIGVKKEVDFSAWYQSVLIKAEMLEYYSVSGCYILRPWSYIIWEEIQDWFNKAMSVQNVYFPMLVSQKVLEREKDHIEGFSPEVAWVTRAGSSDLEEPVAIRPTSETVMYPYYAKWIKSHRDLPLKLNQWNNVVQWEFKHPQPFLRTRQFLWQEGHTAHLTKAEADKEVREILDLYCRVYEELLAVPVIPGIKSKKEKFAGALYTTTIEGFVPPSGRGIQAATSHCLGQNFSRPEMFNIMVEDSNDPSGQGKTFACSVWCPAKTSDEDRAKINNPCDDLAKSLIDGGVRARADLREGYAPGYKFNDWEQKGVPLRLEIGPNDLAKQQTLSVRRDTGAKIPVALADLATTIPKTLETIQSVLSLKVTRWEDFVPTLDSKCIAVIPWCEREACRGTVLYSCI